MLTKAKITDVKGPTDNRGTKGGGRVAQGRKVLYLSSVEATSRSDIGMDAVYVRTTLLEAP